MKKLIALAVLVMAGHAYGGPGAIKSCYTSPLPAPESSAATELFVVIDQTTVFDMGLKQSIADNIRPFLSPGNAISVLRFSAFTQGQYTDVLMSAQLDRQLDEKQRNDISKPLLAKFDRCITNQPKLAGQLVGAALRAAFGNSSNSIGKSDVLASLKEISSMVRQSKARRKVVLLASDMLENSSVTSFYSKQSVRLLNPEKELNIAKSNELLGNFGGAEVYVIGAGLLAEDAKSAAVYRSPQIMRGLSTFWSYWLKNSGARLMGFGQPALLSPIAQ